MVNDWTARDGSTIATMNDLVLPRDRATATALFAMVSTFSGTALGPYAVGFLSDNIAATGVEPGEALDLAMVWALALPAAGMVLAIAAIPHVETDEASLVARARELGETI